MDSRPYIDGPWLERLGKEYPKAAGQLHALAAHLLTKEPRLYKLVLFCATRPELPMIRMFAEYGAALDDVALRHLKEPANQRAASFRAEARPGSKRHRTRSKFIETALRLILERPSWKMEELAAEAGLAIATLHRHFDSRGAVIVAAYDQLLSNEEPGKA